MTLSYRAKLEAERIHLVEYWESSRAWFKDQGYFLYENVNEDGVKYEYSKPTLEYPDTPEMSFDDAVEDPFPYAFMGPRHTHPNLGRSPYSTMERLQGPITYAQDSEGRHVAIKRLKNAEEYKVLRLLKDQPRLLDPNSFPSVIPILDLLEYDAHWFAVMPRWGSNINHSTFFPTFRIGIQYLISLLEGLAFLHELRIFNRDIDVRNTLVNNIASALRYAIMDFDLAMVLDEKTYGSDPRLPIGLLTDFGFGSRPYEVMHAYVDFDPFKYDVACLGIHFSDEFGQIITDVPLLAPLIDRMTTSDIDKRFTASEALAFARNIILPAVSPRDRFERRSELTPVFHRIDRWAGLPESFIAEWGSYRENHSSWPMRFQNWLHVDSDDWAPGWYIMYYYRYIKRILTWLPRFTLHVLTWASQLILRPLPVS